jgi:hypothetical protein
MWVQCIDCIHYDDYSLKKRGEVYERVSSKGYGQK